MFKTGSAGNVIAALCNIFFPGLGQLIQGRLLLAIFLFIFVTLGYWFWFLVFPAIIAALLHLFSIINAATYKSND
ncbi:MAG: hypothetical protein HRU06_04535 [Oceanospirillaceae bacterium]|nr:hypothetical protein [Oceanospirillaceae bacterium]